MSLKNIDYIKYTKLVCFLQQEQQKDKILDHNNTEATKGVFNLKNTSKVPILFGRRVKILALEFFSWIQMLLTNFRKRKVYFPK